MMSHSLTCTFWQWFVRNAGRLQQDDGRRSAASVQKQLALVNESLGVEVSDDNNVRELIISVGRDRGAFQMVKDIVRAAPVVSGWTFTALKPARGFDFTISANGVDVVADELKFEPLESPEQPERLGVRVFVPDVLDAAPGMQDTLWLVLETGIGEELASRITFLEAAPANPTNDDSLPITDLGRFVQWFFSTKAQQGQRKGKRGPRHDR